MLEVIDTETDHVNPTGPPDTPAIWLVGDDAEVLARLHEVIQGFERDYEIIDIEEPKRLMVETYANTPVLCCVICSTAPDDTRRAIALVGKLAGNTPILLIDRRDSTFDLANALATGAWDCTPFNEDAVLVARLNQGLEVGRSRQELLHLGDRLNKAQRRLDVLLSQGTDAHAQIIDGRVEDANPAFARLVGVNDIESVRGSDLRSWVRLSDRQALGDALDTVCRQAIDTNLVFHLETTGIRPRPMRALLRPASTDQPQTPGNAVDIVLQEAGDRQGMRSELAQRPPIDGRMALHNVLANSLGRAREHVLGLIFIAVDEIAMLQSQLGLARSDLLFQEVGLFLLEALQGEDRCFRFGAGEYVILVERQSREEISAAAVRIHGAVSNEHFGDESHSVTLSMTTTHSVLAGDAGDNNRCLQRIMERAYALRNDGGDTCQDCSETVAADDEPTAEDEWSTRLQDALAQNRFSLAFQGITSLAGDSQPYFDVLLRYIDDRGSLIRPGQFLSAAQATGLMPDIDRWVTRRAIEVVAQELARDVELALFVKLSVATITTGGEFLSWLQQTVAAHDVPRRSLIFSFREDDARTHARPAKTLAVELDAQGFRVALTHFSSTPESVQVLNNLPVSFVKLAPDFAKDVAGDSDSERLTQVIASTREHKIPLIAEQIEDANSMARLWQAGVNYVQGHFIQEPDTEALAHGHNGML